MNKLLFSGAMSVVLAVTAVAAPLSEGSASADSVMSHNTLLTTVTVDEMEVRENDDRALKGDLRFGDDRDKLRLKTDWKKNSGETEKAELYALYNRAIAPFWDLQLGVRHDFEMESDSRNWGVIGLNGLAPYFFVVDSMLFVGKGGDTALRLEAEYELLFTQRWILTPAIEADFFGQNNYRSGTGSGLSDIELGLRLRYEFTRQFAPYIGVHYEKKFGNTADFARELGEDTQITSLVAGLYFWL
ncbi:copper resistance protein B [Microbulbifer thermotolerans]|uniref:copper resistance protein B n=1 Tax=Microbulbifer thermotolerans TaxID=252514 RepID=UPI00224ACA0F|nr:copper resistance protein B [Microbulbifer thermotolerans]MCX2784556.1 copper resistance protein B [Microbulbifer thermotolerans]